MVDLRRRSLTRRTAVRWIVAPLLFGAAATVAVAWACAMWSPVRTSVDPFPNAAGISETADPDGYLGLYYRDTGFGWSYSWLRGERAVLRGRPEVSWCGPYGGIYHHVAGWPLPALWSRVEVLDSQKANRVVEGEPDHEPVSQRERWELPLDEILHRGLATKDLPDRLRAQPDRRLPLVPLTGGFACDTIIYAAVFAVLTLVYDVTFGQRRARHAGFLVLVKTELHRAC